MSHFSTQGEAPPEYIRGQTQESKEQKSSKLVQKIEQILQGYKQEFEEYTKVKKEEELATKQNSWPEREKNLAPPEGRSDIYPFSRNFDLERSWNQKRIPKFREKISGLLQEEFQHASNEVILDTIEKIIDNFIGLDNEEKWSFLTNNNDHRGTLWGSYEILYRLIEQFDQNINTEELDQKNKKQLNTIFQKIIQNVLILINTKDRNKEDTKALQEIDKAPNKKVNKKYALQDRQILTSDDYFPTYDLIQKTINQVATYGNKETIDGLIGLLKLEKADVKAKTTAAIKEINPAYGANEIIKYLSSEKSIEAAREDPEEEWLRFVLLNVLNRLETGEIEINDENELEYLNKIIKLEGAEEVENLENARRLSPTGEIGIFENQALQGYIDLEQSDLISDDERIKKQLLSFSIDMLLIDNENEENEKKQKFLEQFKKEYLSFLDSSLFDNAEFNMNDLTLYEQGALIKLLLNSDEEKKNKTKKIIEKYGKPGIKSFLTVGVDEQTEEKILNLEENGGPIRANEIFNEYAKIIDLIYLSKQKIKETFQKGAEKIPKKEVMAEFLKRANRLLDQIIKSETQDDQEKGVEKLKNLREDIFVFTSIFKTTFKDNEEINFEQVKNLNFQKTKLKNIDEIMQEKMLAISADNWKDRGHPKNEIHDKFENILESEEHQEDNFYLLTRDTQKNDTDLVSFVRLTEEDQTTKKATSLNVAPEYRGSAIGESMLKETLLKKAEDYIIQATVFPELKVGTKYVDELEFNIVGVGQNNDEFKIEINKETNRTSEFKSNPAITNKDIKKDYQQDKKTLEVDHEYEIKKYDVGQDKQQVIEKVEDKTSQGFEVVRYFEDPDASSKDEERGSSQRFFVFEKIED